MPRLTLLAKGNSDVVESLFACRDRSLDWNGLNEALRERRPDWRVRIRHETMTRSDALLAAKGVVPDAFRHLSIAAPFGLESQFSAALFDGKADAHVLSIQGDVTIRLLRHRASGHLLLSGDAAALTTADRVWLRSECELLPLLTPDEALANWLGIVARIRRRSAAPILVYNLSSVVPGDAIDTYRGFETALTTRIKRFNLAAVALSEQTDAIVVDVDRLAARKGADALKLDGLRLNCAGNRMVAEDVVRILDDQGCFDRDG